MYGDIGATVVNLPSSITDGGISWTNNRMLFRHENTLPRLRLHVRITTGIGPGTTIAGTASAAIPSKTWVLWEFAPAGAGPLRM